MVLVKRISRGEQQQQHEVCLENGKQRHAECFPVAMMWTKQAHVVLRKVVEEQASAYLRSREGRHGWQTRGEVGRANTCTSLMVLTRCEHVGRI